MKTWWRGLGDRNEKMKQEKTLGAELEARREEEGDDTHPTKQPESSGRRRGTHRRAQSKQLRAQP